MQARKQWVTSYGTKRKNPGNEESYTQWKYYFKMKKKKRLSQRSKNWGNSLLTDYSAGRIEGSCSDYELELWSTQRNEECQKKSKLK